MLVREWRQHDSRRDQQQTSRIIGERLNPTNEAFLDSPCEPLRLDQAEAARQLPRRQAPRELEQRQRITACLSDDSVSDSLIQLEPHGRAQQRAGIPIPHAIHLQLGHVSKLLAGLARGEHDRNRLSQETPSDEPQDLEGGVVEPLRVVDEAEQRLLLRDLREEGKRPEGNEEAIGRVPGREAERDAQSMLLGLRKTIELAEHRRAELMEASKRELHLGLDPGDLRYPESGGPVSDIPQ